MTMKFGDFARTMQCDQVEFAVGAAASGAVDILMMPTKNGAPMLPNPIAMTPDMAMKMAAQLVRMVEAAQGPRLIGQPQFSKIRN